MMETKDLQHLRDLLMKWRDVLPEKSDSWAYCMTVLLDVQHALRDQQRNEESARTVIEPA